MLLLRFSWLCRANPLVARAATHAERNDACITGLSRIAVIGLFLLTKDSKVRSTPPRNKRGRVSKQSILS